MNAESLFGVLYIAVVVAGCVAMLLAASGIFNLLYRFIPAFRCWYDRLDDGLPNWDDGEEW